MFSFFKKNKIINKAIFKKCASLCEFAEKRANDDQCNLAENEIIKRQAETTIKAYCAYCEKQTNMFLDFLYARKSDNGKLIPNFRERIICENCGLNNRLRATYHLLEMICPGFRNKKMYITEEVTPFYKLLKQKNKKLVGSEYFSDQKRGKVVIPNYPVEINNEDLTSLSFSEEEFDVVLSLEVLEHIPEYKKALSEVFRIMKKNGVFIFSVPFITGSQKNIIRATIDNGEIRHLLPAEYHGDPVSDNNCLCFHHFGWDILHDLKEAGFVDVGIYSYKSLVCGYFGNGVILYAIK